MFIQLLIIFFNVKKKINKKLTIPKNVQKSIAELIEDCSNSDISMRPTFEEIINTIRNPNFYDDPNQNLEFERLIAYHISRK
mgnify:CR=1 FL=1